MDAIEEIDIFLGYSFSDDVSDMSQEELVRAAIFYAATEEARRERVLFFDPLIGWPLKIKDFNKCESRLSELLHAAAYLAEAIQIELDKEDE